jgi:excisionase family DNA binding protein
LFSGTRTLKIKNLTRTPGKTGQRIDVLRLIAEDLRPAADFLNSDEAKRDLLRVLRDSEDLFLARAKKDLTKRVMVILYDTITDKRSVMKNVIREEVRSKNKMDKLYTIEEVCENLRLSRATVNRYKSDGLLRSIKFPGRGKGKGGAVRFDEKDVEKFKKSCRLQPLTS